MCSNLLCSSHTLSYWSLKVSTWHHMVPHGKELSEVLKRHSVALHEDGQGYKKITVKYCSRGWSPPSRNWVAGQCSSMTMTPNTPPRQPLLTEEAGGKGDGLAKHVSWLEPNRTSLGDPQAEGGGVQSLKYLPTPRRHHGGVEGHSSGYLWSSSKHHAQESKGSPG